MGIGDLLKEYREERMQGRTGSASLRTTVTSICWILELIDLNVPGHWRRGAEGRTKE